MNTDDPINRALALTSGANFHRCALQVNPQDYSETFRGQESGIDTETHAEAIVQKAAKIGVSVLAITNHNDASSVPAFRNAAASNGIHVFPGFELSSNEGVHILCIYPQETEDQKLQRFLGEFGITVTKPSPISSDKSFNEILRMVRHQGGVSVAAHITNVGGLFRVLKGQARIRAWQNENLLAVQIPESVQGLPQDARLIIENKNSEYRRTRTVSQELAAAAINARDVVTAKDLADPSATCLIKMSEVSIEGLRQAFLDPSSRIRLNSDPTPDEHVELVAMAWDGGFLDGAAVHLNSNLNVLVGGRGTGKSTVVESLRYVLGLDPIGEDAHVAHEGIIRQVLRSGTKVSMLVRSYRPVQREYRIERTVPNPPVIRNYETGEVLNLRPEDIVPRIEVYGQHEISELARNSEKRTRLLDRFVERDPSLLQQKTNLRRNLKKTRRSILDVRMELRQIEERLATLPGLEETLNQFQEAGLEDRLRDRSLLVREERVLDSIPQRLETIRELLVSLRNEIPIDRVFLSPKALEDLPGRRILADADEFLERFSREIEELARRFEEAFSRVDEGIARIRSRWNERKHDVQTAYEEILRELQQTAVDGEEFIRLRREIEALRPLRERQALLTKLENEHLTQRRSLLADWEDIKAEEFRRLDRAAKNVSKQLNGRVQVNVTAAGDREPLYALLRTDVGGQLANTMERLEILPSISLIDFASACREGADELRGRYGLTPAQARNIADAAPEVPLRIEELDLPPMTSIQLNTAPVDEAPSWQALESVSAGQKATAVLLLLLLESDAPLIVDQPEDDLDNRFITEGVVPRMREEKRRRQFVFSTHNANIPVLGDAELIIGLTASGEAEGGNANVASEHMGSIDVQPVRELVEEILEGGRDAFETRRLKYGF